MNKEPEPLSEMELLRLENMRLRREVLQRDDEMLARDIAQAHCLSLADYGKTWGIQNGFIVTKAEQVEQTAEVV